MMTVRMYWSVSGLVDFDTAFSSASTSCRHQNESSIMQMKQSMMSMCSTDHFCVVTVRDHACVSDLGSVCLHKVVALYLHLIELLQQRALGLGNVAGSGIIMNIHG